MTIIIALAVKEGFSPLDRKLKLVRHSYTPETIKQAIRQGTEIPSYRRAAESFQAQTKIPISKSTLQRLVDEYGGRLVEEQDMKQAGMRWSRKGAQAMLALRSVLLSDRWDEVWPLLHPALKPT